MDVLTLYAGSDNLIELVGLRAQSDGSMQADASVSVTLLDSTDTPVVGATWPLAMAYVTETDGVYRATLPDTLSVTAGQRYKARVIADDGPGRRAQWDLDVLCRTRRR